MLRIPNELLLKILSYTMRSEMPVHLEHFLQLGQLLQNIRNENCTDNRALLSVSTCLESCFHDELDPGLSTWTCSESWFLNKLDLGQLEHFRDWLLINSTCRSFRAWGKEAFFSEKIFVIRPQFIKTLCGESAKSMSVDNIAAARACIRHVIAPSPYCSATSHLMCLPRFHTLQRLCSLSIQPGCNSSDILLRLNLRSFKRNPLPEELLGLLQGIGLRVDQLQMNLLYENNEEMHQYHMQRLADTVYPHLRILSAWKVKGRRQVSDDRI